MKTMIQSNSQFGQDLWVLQLFREKRNGFYMEIGAGNGLWISNTLVMERHFGWTGILVEPTGNYAELIKNRPDSICVNAVIASTHKEVTLCEIFDSGQADINANASNNSLLSTVEDTTDPIDENKHNSRWGVFRNASKRSAIPFAEVLRTHNAPQVIDYFSLDVEGFEYEILKEFPFDEYSFGCLGIERPPQELHNLLIAHGYQPRAKLGEDLMYTPAF